MGLLQAAYETYTYSAHMAGIAAENTAALTPISHTVQNAQIELTIRDDGTFLGALAIAKKENKTIIPVTEESAGRTSGPACPHPLCDQLRYLAAYSGAKGAAYLAQLSQWAASEYGHPKVSSVLRYVRGGTILSDLQTAGVITLDEQGTPADGKLEGVEYEKCLVRWRVLPVPEGVPSACWEDRSLFEAFIAYYTSLHAVGVRDLCMISGEEDLVATSHPKGIVSASFGAKLISANDSAGFTYRGRFASARQAGTIGYTATQKAHSALRWVAANQGVIFGGRAFLCWNKKGKPMPTFSFLGAWGKEDEPVYTQVQYRQNLLRSLGGYRQALLPEDGVVLAALEAATTGRLSVTYYNELNASDFLDRLDAWFESCCWSSPRFGIRSPSAKRIVECAFGTQRESFIEADERLLREHIQRILHCIVDAGRIPPDMVRALTARASTPLAYSAGNREIVGTTACAIIRKYRNDKLKREEWSMTLDMENANRSYLFGRLLAVAEQVERSTYDREEGREPNAIRLQTVFCQRPMYAWGILDKALNPYFARLQPGLRRYFKDIIGEISEKLPPAGDPELGKKLEDTYLLGYYLQRTALTRKKENVMEEKKDEYSEPKN